MECSGLIVECPPQDYMFEHWSTDGNTGLGACGGCWIWDLTRKTGSLGTKSS